MLDLTEVGEQDIQALFAAFRAPLTPDEIEWKIATNKAGQNATLVPYIDNRAVLNRLDKAFGPGGWQGLPRTEANRPGGCVTTSPTTWNGLASGGWTRQRLP